MVGDDSARPPTCSGNFPDLHNGYVTTDGVKSSQLGDLRGIGAAAVALGMLGVVLHAFALGGIFGRSGSPMPPS